MPISLPTAASSTWKPDRRSGLAILAIIAIVIAVAVVRTPGDGVYRAIGQMLGMTFGFVLIAALIAAFVKKLRPYTLALAAVAAGVVTLIDIDGNRRLADSIQAFEALVEEADNRAQLRELVRASAIEDGPIGIMKSIMTRTQQIEREIGARHPILVAPAPEELDLTAVSVQDLQARRDMHREAAAAAPAATRQFTREFDTLLTELPEIAENRGIPYGQLGGFLAGLSKGVEQSKRSTLELFTSVGRLNEANAQMYTVLIETYGGWRYQNGTVLFDDDRHTQRFNAFAQAATEAEAAIARNQAQSQQPTSG